LISGQTDHLDGGKPLGRIRGGIAEWRQLAYRLRVRVAFVKIAGATTNVSAANGLCVSRLFPMNSG